jgi:predicted DNA-binding transcriptional regulator AlpA
MLETRMLKASDVCKILGISRETLFKLTAAGEFPGAMKATPNPNGHWRYPEQAVRDYLKRNAYIPEPVTR